jgi:hypothetical protein
MALFGITRVIFFFVSFFGGHLFVLFEEVQFKIPLITSTIFQKRIGCSIVEWQNVIIESPFYSSKSGVGSLKLIFVGTLNLYF